MSELMLMLLLFLVTPALVAVRGFSFSVLTQRPLLQLEKKTESALSYARGDGEEQQEPQSLPTNQRQHFLETQPANLVQQWLDLLPSSLKEQVPIEWIDNERYKKPPMPPKWPLIGTLPDFFARGGVNGLCEVYESMYKDYGPVFGLSILGDDQLVMSDPRVFDKVLKKEGRFPVGGAEGVKTFVDYYAENNLTMATKGVSRGPEWKEWRQALNPDMFVLWDTYLPAIADAAAKVSAVAGTVANSGSLAFENLISRAAFDMFSAVLYGESPVTVDTSKADPDDVKFVENTQKAFDVTGKMITNPLEKVFETNLYQEFVVSMDKTFDFAEKRTKAYADQAKHYQIEEQSAATAASDSKCPIQGVKLAAANTLNTEFLNPSYIERLVNRGKLSNDEISEVGAPLLMAGVDTTAYVMSWLYLNLASNPDVQTKLAQELKQVLKGADVTTREQLDSLPYLRACIRESHRLTPPSPMSIKILEEDIDITVDAGSDQHLSRSTDCGTVYRVKAGQRISLNLRGFPMDPKYVTNPKEYRPERFLPEAVASRRGTPSEIIDHVSFADPFGRGKRRCLGANIAMAEIAILAARMIQDWEIVLSDPSKKGNWKPKQKLLLKADPYPAMKLASRQ